MSTDDSQPLINHLIELRRRVLNALICVLLVFLSLVYFSNDIYQIVADPLIRVLPYKSSMIATDVASPFLIPIKLTAIVSVFISVPVILYQLWAFVSPALYQHERRLVIPLLFSSTLLFYAGVVFAYFIVFPLVFSFFTRTTPIGVISAIDISNYLNFIMMLFLAFGIAFEIPIAIILLCWSGIINPQRLKEKRPYVIVSIFVLAMFLTPPDVFSQTLLAIPMYLLFEIGIFFANCYVKKSVSRTQKNKDE